MNSATEPVAFADLLHAARAYLAAVHAPESIPPRYKQLAAWRALPVLEGAGYDHDRIWQHLRTLERLTDMAQTRRADRQRAAAFMDALLPALERRAREHGHAYVTEPESRFMGRYNLRQPGHTRYRYSVPGEDLSDATQLGTDEEHETMTENTTDQPLTKGQQANQRNPYQPACPLCGEYMVSVWIGRARWDYCNTCHVRQNSWGGRPDDPGAWDPDPRRLAILDYRELSADEMLGPGGLRSFELIGELERLTGRRVQITEEELDNDREGLRVQADRSRFRTNDDIDDNNDIDDVPF